MKPVKELRLLPTRERQGTLYHPSKSQQRYLQVAFGTEFGRGKIRVVGEKKTTTKQKGIFEVTVLKEVYIQGRLN